MVVRLARAGLREIVVATLGLACVVGAASWLLGWGWYGWVAVAIAAPVWLWVLYFFRDPDRTIPAGPGLFVSPADGVVTDVTPVGPESELGCAGVRIGVFMSIFSVHVNRAPCDAEVTATAHAPGDFLDVRNPAGWSRNESVTISLAYQRHPLVVRQIAGLVARRIVCDCRTGDALRRGQRLGMIKFGSRLELLLPEELNAEVCVSVGQKVLAGSSVLASHSPIRSVPAGVGHRKDSDAQVR